MAIWHAGEEAVHVASSGQQPDSSCPIVTATVFVLGAVWAFTRWLFGIDYRVSRLEEEHASNRKLLEEILDRVKQR